MINCIGESTSSHLAKVQITKVRVTVYKTLAKEFYLSAKEHTFYARQIDCERAKPQDLAYDAIMGLYAISRARV